MISLYAYKIHWDTDEQNVKLPDKICIDDVIHIYEGTDEQNDIISDYITEKTGFCNYGFSVKFENN